MKLVFDAVTGLGRCDPIVGPFQDRIHNNRSRPKIWDAFYGNAHMDTYSLFLDQFLNKMNS